MNLKNKLTTKQILIEKMCANSGENKKLVSNMVTSFLKALEDFISENEELSITGYFTIKKRFKNSYMGHDPRTSKPIKISPSYLLSCRFGSKLKQAANRSLNKKK